MTTLKSALKQAVEVLESVWRNVCEMDKDSRTDFKLERLAKLDLRAITDHCSQVHDAIAAAKPLL